MDKIRTGLAAYGMSGRVFHAPFISTNPHFELTAVMERSKELSREKYPDACIVRSFEELIGLEGLDLVVINTPDSTHYEYARRALEAGKHSPAFAIHTDLYTVIFHTSYPMVRSVLASLIGVDNLGFSVFFYRLIHHQSLSFFL